jgi:hypothetical protein
MIEFPPFAVPNGATPALLDFGGTLRPALGGPLQRVNRQGSRYQVAMTFPPFVGDREGRIVLARLLRAKQEGGRVEYPLPQTQRIAGTPVVDGSGQGGSTIAVRGIFPQSAILEGWWLSIEDTSGQHYLHNVAGQVVAGADGRATIPVTPMLRKRFSDGCTVHLAKPMVEGLIDGDTLGWSISVENFIGISFTIEEAA